MGNNDAYIPARITQLIVGFFLHTIDEAEQYELDEWISESMDNQLLFESCVEIAGHPVHPIDEDDVSEDFRYIADLFMKKIKKTITQKELERLNEWKLSTPIDSMLLQSLEESSSIQMLFERLKMHFYNLNRN